MVAPMNLSLSQRVHTQPPTMCQIDHLNIPASLRLITPAPRKQISVTVSPRTYLTHQVSGWQFALRSPLFDGSRESH